MSDKPPNESELMELYKLHLDLADRVSQRREAANRLFVGLVVAILTAFIIIIRFGDSGNGGGEVGNAADEGAPNSETGSADNGDASDKERLLRLTLHSFLLVCGGGVGFLLCLAWVVVIQSYRDWSDRTAYTLAELESRIPLIRDSKFLNVEKQHTLLFLGEKLVPGSFLFIFVLMLIMGFTVGITAAYKYGALLTISIYLVLAIVGTIGIMHNMFSDTNKK